MTKKGNEMKSFLSVLAITLVTMVASSQAEAAQCRIELENGRGMTLEVFRGHGYDRIDACRDANRQCRRAIQSGYHRARVLRCVDGNIRRPLPNRTCTVRMTGPMGHRTFGTYIGREGRRGQSACMQALRQCQDDRYRQGRTRARCEITTQGSNGRRDDRGGRGRGRRI